MTEKFKPAQMWALTILRVLIGWHFLYEGFYKLIKSGWSAAGFLSQSKWIFEGFFKSLAGNEAILKIVNLLNIWGLILIGISLILGFLERAGAIAGILLLGLYYLSTPPMPGLHYSIPMEGNYLIVNKNLIEMAALLVLFLIPTGKFAGIDRFISIFRGRGEN
jgi:thiosulfate dehydrogenase [quinone] large subunit